MAEKILVDTDVLIEAFERRNEAILGKLFNYNIYVSYVSLYEYLYGFKYIGKDVVKEKDMLEKVVNIVYPSQDVILKTLEIDVDLSRKGEKIPQADIIIAATAIVLGMPLYTMDLTHFSRLKRYGLKLVTI
ncbi:MAG: type II toxin-antitoxin system VapC family toxin [Thermoprotei archaeon]|nr:MAG: type II toxin-antitoxin system VapC family toxin [Thermoprotei archaeon]